MLRKLHFPWKNERSRVGKRAEISGSFKCKGTKGWGVRGGGNGNLTVSLTWKASTHIRDILKNSLDPSLFLAMDFVGFLGFFFSRGLKKWKETLLLVL